MDFSFGSLPFLTPRIGISPMGLPMGTEVVSRHRPERYGPSRSEDTRDFTDPSGGPFFGPPLVPNLPMCESGIDPVSNTRPPLPSVIRLSTPILSNNPSLFTTLLLTSPTSPLTVHYSPGVINLVVRTTPLERHDSGGLTYLLGTNSRSPSYKTRLLEFGVLLRTVQTPGCSDRNTDRLHPSLSLSSYRHSSRSRCDRLYHRV